MISEHILEDKWDFYFMKRVASNKGLQADSYGHNIKKIATVSTIEEFWSTYSHLIISKDVHTDYHIFRSGIKPIWEDENNLKGGKWILRLKKGISPRLLEYLAMAVIGNQFAREEVCGIVLSLRFGEDVLSLWTRTAHSKSLDEMKKTFIRVLELPEDVTVTYKAHDLSIKDNGAIQGTMDIVEEFSSSEESVFEDEQLVESSDDELEELVPEVGDNGKLPLIVVNDDLEPVDPRNIVSGRRK